MHRRDHKAALRCSSSVVGAMQTYRLLYFRESLLESAEEVRARDLLEAVQKAAGQPPEIRVEVWSDQRRVGVIGASSRR